MDRIRNEWFRGNAGLEMRLVRYGWDGLDIYRRRTVDIQENRSASEDVVNEDMQLMWQTALQSHLK